MRVFLLLLVLALGACGGLEPPVPLAEREFLRITATETVGEDLPPSDVDMLGYIARSGFAEAHVLLALAEPVQEFGETSSDGVLRDVIAIDPSDPRWEHTMRARLDVASQAIQARFTLSGFPVGLPMDESLRADIENFARVLIAHDLIRYGGEKGRRAWAAFSGQSAWPTDR